MTNKRDQKILCKALAKLNKVSQFQITAAGIILSINGLNDALKYVSEIENNCEQMPFEAACQLHLWEMNNEFCFKMKG